ncbi:MAG: S8 family serine peptidase, partial [Phycisphaerae bacterium]|nr:S8 family serine peptidase [Phycisphaerae bacterium]
MRKLVALILLTAASAAMAQQNRRYIVELDGEPAAVVAARTDAPAPRAALRQYATDVDRRQTPLRRILDRNRIDVVLTLDTLVNGVVVEVPPRVAALLERLPGVKQVHPVARFSSAMDRAVPLQHVPEAYAWAGYERAGEGVKVAIIDTGIDSGHPVFQDPTLTTPPGYPRVNAAADLAYTSNKVIVARSYEHLYRRSETPASARDCVGHGTSVALCVAGVPATGPRATISGVAPRAWLGSYKVFPGCDRNEATSDVILKAMEDAIHDGMDILNLSLGGEPVPLPAADLMQLAADRAAALGVLVIHSIGNSGPQARSVGASGTDQISALGIGASENDREFVVVAEVDDHEYEGLPGNGPAPLEPIVGQLKDVAALDGNGQACSPLPAGSLQNLIAFIRRGTCNFVVKLTNAQDAGAVAALVYSDGREITIMNVEGATLPGMMISTEDGDAVKNQFAGRQTLPASLDFLGVVKPLADNAIADFSSRGPGPAYSIKPDMVAIGSNVYTAKSQYEDGEPNAYYAVDGTSFSAPTVAGAAAVLKAARPNLSPQQYYSLLVNTATIMEDNAGVPLAVQHQGAGRLNLGRAIRSDVAVSPISISFGAGNPTVDVTRRIRITNLGIHPEVYSFRAQPHVPGPAPTVTPASLALAYGQSAYIQVRFSATGLAPGQYQGYLHIEGSRPSSAVHLAYWYGVGDGVPTQIAINDNPLPGELGEETSIFVRVSDAFGVAVTDHLPTATVNSGGGEVLGVTAMGDLYPGMFEVKLRLSAVPEYTTLRIGVGQLDRYISIEAR